MSNYYAGYAPTRSKFIPDAVNELRNRNKVAAISVTTAETAIAFESRHLYGLKVELGAAPYTGFNAATAYWEISIEASTQLATGFKSIAKTVIGRTEMGLVGIDGEITFTGLMIEAAVPFSQYVRIVATKVGLPGPLNYNAHLSPMNL